MVTGVNIISLFVGVLDLRFEGGKDDDLCEAELNLFCLCWAPFSGDRLALTEESVGRGFTNLFEVSSFSVCVPQFLNTFSSSSSFKAFMIGVSKVSLCFFINKLGELPGERSFSREEWYLQ